MKTPRAPLCCATLAFPINTEPANGQVEQVATPVDPMGQFVVAKGLTIQPFASQGLLSNPASIDVDDRGRIWIGETVNYRKKARKAGTEY